MDIKIILTGLAIFVGISIILALLLALADQFLKVEEDTRLEALRGLLPGIDCGACGYPGCSAFAQGILDGEVKKISGCRVAKAAKHKEIYDYLKATPDQNGKILDIEI